MRSLASINRAVSRRIRTRHRGDTWRARSHDERSGSRDESGAVLILALVFLVTVSVIVGALTEWTTNDLQNNAKLQRQRKRSTARRPTRSTWPCRTSVTTRCCTHSTTRDRSHAQRQPAKLLLGIGPLPGVQHERVLQRPSGTRHKRTPGR